MLVVTRGPGGRGAPDRGEPPSRTRLPTSAARRARCSPGAFRVARTLPFSPPRLHRGRPLAHAAAAARRAEGDRCRLGVFLGSTPLPAPRSTPPPPVQPRPARVPRAAAGGRACDGRGACLSHTPNTPPLTPSTAAHQRGPSSQFLVHATTPTLHCGPYSTDAPRSVVSPLLSLDFFFFLDTSKVACVSLRGCGVAWVRGCVGGVSGGGPPLGASRGRTRRRAPAGVSRAAL